MRRKGHPSLLTSTQLAVSIPELAVNAIEPTQVAPAEEEPVLQSLAGRQRTAVPNARRLHQKNDEDAEFRHFFEGKQID